MVMLTLKRLLVIGALIAMSGCATTDYSYTPVFADRDLTPMEPVEPIAAPAVPAPSCPRSGETLLWDQIAEAFDSLVILDTWGEGIELTDLADPDAAAVDTTNWLCFEREAVADIQAAWEAADYNAGAVERQSSVIEHLDTERRQLLAAGRARETQLDELYRAYRTQTWEIWAYRAGLILIGAAAIF